MVAQTQKLHIMWHYRIINQNGNIILDSSRREDFYGYSTEGKAYLVAIAAKSDNRLSDLHTIETYESIPDCVLSSFESSQEI